MDSEGGYYATITFDMGEFVEINRFDEFNTVTGGAGADRFRFADIYQEDARDVITDFTQNLDRIQLVGENYAALGSSVEAGEFAYGTAATTADQHLLYNKTDGALYYDADGSGSQEAVQLATVLNAGVPANLDHTSFEIV